MKQALACCGTPLTPMLNHTGLLNAARWVTRMNFSSCVEGLGLGLVDEVAALDAPGGDGVDDAIDDLAQRRSRARAVPSVPRKYFWATMLVAFSDQVGGELDTELLEGDRAVLPVADPSIAAFPDHLVVRVHARRGEVPADSDGETIRRQ